jgi:NAD(P)H dehydrogenase (quinone)
MATIAIVYESRTGHVKAMAEAVARGVAARGGESRLMPVEQADIEAITRADGLIVGSFTSYGQMAGGMKAFFDNSPFASWAGKAGGAFASSGLAGGGCETTVLSLLHALLIHGMRVQGDSEAAHFGPVCAGEPDAETLRNCERLGERVTRLAGA